MNKAVLDRKQCILITIFIKKMCTCEKYINSTSIRWVLTGEWRWAMANEYIPLLFVLIFVFFSF